MFVQWFVCSVFFSSMKIYLSFYGSMQDIAVK